MGIGYIGYDFRFSRLLNLAILSYTSYNSVSVELMSSRVYARCLSQNQGNRPCGLLRYDGVLFIYAKFQQLPLEFPVDTRVEVE